jgi:tRNA-specific 2-thiouridylase
MLLMEQGYEVVGVTFRTYGDSNEKSGCGSLAAVEEAKQNAARLGIEHHVADFREPFRQCVIQNFIDEYMSGRTPNPCVLCNSCIKWGEMVRMADELQCGYIATGHYAQIRERNGYLYLANAVDTQKDQTYFLWMLTEENLRRTIFPLGGLTKSEVREIARQHGYESLAQKAESQEICFVEDDYRSFLRANVPDYNTRVQPGCYVNAEGKILGTHQGFANYTIGQRKGLGVALGYPAYVTHIDSLANTVTLGNNDDLWAKTLLATHLRIRDINWVQAHPHVQARVRYRSQSVEAEIQLDIQPNTMKNDHTSRVGRLTFVEPVWGVTPGQSVVLYQDGLVIGGGIIQ